MRLLNETSGYAEDEPMAFTPLSLHVVQNSHDSKGNKFHGKWS